MTIPRCLHRAYARLMGYFWIPCPRCREYFGGHQVTPGKSIRLDDGTSWCVCPECVKEITSVAVDTALDPLTYIRPQHTEDEWFALYGKFTLSLNGNQVLQNMTKLFTTDSQFRSGDRSESLWKTMTQVVQS